MAKPNLEPAAPYENLHLVARDYLDRLRQLLDALQHRMTQHFAGGTFTRWLR